jgi:hypothetical protein
MFSSRYEHVPGSNEEHNIPSDAQHYMPHVYSQSHEIVELRSMDWQTERIPESYQSFQHDRDNTLHVDADQNMNQSFGSRNPKGTAVIDAQPLRPKNQGATIGWLSDWWWWELGSVLLSLSCIVAIIVTLLVTQNKPLSSWHSSIAPNALISVGNIET